MDENLTGEQPPVDPQKALSSELPPPPGIGAGPIPPGRSAPPPPQPPQYSQRNAPWPPAPMYPPPPPRHSFTRGILVTLATTIFGFSLLLNLYMLLAGGILARGDSSSTEVLRAGEDSQLIAVVPLSGIIMDSEFERFNRLLNAAEKDGIKALIVEIDSPGGAVTASDMIYNRIVQFRKNHPGVPVTATMGSMATSGGYYAACGADYIIAQRTTMTGNIGVLLPRYNISDLAKRIGVQETTIESTGAPFKNAGSMFEPETPEDTAYFRGIIDDAFAQFKSVVRDGRAGKLKKPLDEIANGKVYMAQQAMDLGLIDQIGYLNDAIDQIAGSASLSKPMAVRYSETTSLTQMFLGAQSQSTAPGRGVSVQISPEVMDRFSSPRMMYLWRGQ